jgi:hypothetical protein
MGILACLASTVEHAGWLNPLKCDIQPRDVFEHSIFGICHPHLKIDDGSVEWAQDVCSSALAKSALES